MSSTTTTGPFPFESLKQAIEQSDVAILKQFYADDAVVEIVNQRSTPSNPHRVAGRNQIGKMLEDICGRAMTHDIEWVARDRDRIAYAERCRYDDGTVVYSMHALDVSGGKIAHEQTVEAWDS